MIIPGTFGLIVDGIVFCIILFLLYVLSMTWPPDSPWAPWWQMPKDIIRKMYAMVGLKKEDVVYELGCGRADAMVIASNEFGAKAIGIEIDPLRIILAKWNVWRSRYSSSLRGVQTTKQSQTKDRHASASQGSELPDVRLLAMTEGITLIKDNFFNIDLSRATVVIVYLVPKALGRLAPKFFKELKKGTRIVSYKYAFPEEIKDKKLQLVKEDKKNEIYFYKIV